MQCVFTLGFISCLYLLRTRVCTDFRNVNNKHCIIITPVEQILQPVDYAWWQKQYTMTDAAHIVWQKQHTADRNNTLWQKQHTAHIVLCGLCLRLPGVNVGYFWRFFAFFQFIGNAFSNTCLVFDIAVQMCCCI